MKIGIIGAGNIGGTVGKLWSKAGHSVKFGSRHPEVLAPLVASCAAGASAGTPDETASFGEVLFFSVPFGAWPELAARMSAASKGKVIIDSANPYPERDGAFARSAIEAGEGAGVPVARLLPGARLVRAFNSVYFKTLETKAHRPGERVGIPLASDDADAMIIAANLVQDAGFEPVVVGPLVRARDFDPGTQVYNTGMTAGEIIGALGI